VILISSAKTSSEIPFYYKWAAAMRLNKIIPVSWLKRSNSISQWFFGLKKAEDKLLLKQMLEDTDPEFLAWSIDKIIHWKNKNKLANVFHIHGKADRLLPYRFIQPDVSIHEGSHFMLINRADEISSIIRKQLEA
jgi:hypothetical protein